MIIRGELVRREVEYRICVISTIDHYFRISYYARNEARSLHRGLMSAMVSVYVVNIYRHDR